MTKARNIADLGSNDVIETTATGVDVTGTVTADGLTVESSSSSTVATFNYTNGTDAFLGLDGTGTPIYLGNKNGDVVFQTSGSGYADKFRIANNGNVSFYEDTGTTAKMVWSSSAESLNLGGIATTNTAGFSQNLALKDLYPSITLEDTGTGTGKWTLGVTEGGIGFWDSITTQYRMRIDSSGSVGIGTASPSNNIEAHDTVDSSLALTTEASAMRFVAYSGANYIQSGTSLAGNSAPLIFTGTNGVNERARIDSSGNLLVNTTTTLTFGDAKFQAKGDTNFWSGTFESSSTVSGRGCVGFVVQNTVAPLARFNHGNTLVGTISTNGSTTNYGTTSDYRLKENVVVMDNASDKVKALKPCRFNFIANPDTTVDGFLAHEAQEVVPEAVTGTKDAVDAEGNPEYQGIDQSKLVPLLTKALQEALTEIDNLKQRVDALENK